MNKQIEEMAKDLKKCLPSSWYWLSSVDSDCYCVAKHFYNAGYRKVDEDEVIINKRELGVLQDDFCNEVDYWKKQTQEIGNITRKEKAREMLQYIYEWAWDFDELAGQEVCKHLAKEYGVELEVAEYDSNAKPNKLR